jgi:hypothetical protein
VKEEAEPNMSRKNYSEKKAQPNTSAPDPVKPEPTADDVEMLALEAEEALGEMPTPVPAPENTNLRELFDRTNGVLVKLKEAEARVKEAENRANERAAQAEEMRKEAARQFEEAANRQKKADKSIAEYQGYLDKLADLARPEGFTLDPIPDNIPSAVDSHKRAYDALRTLNAAQRKAEEATKAANTKEKEFQQRKNELDTLEKTLSAKEKQLKETENKLLDGETKIADRETNAENGFLVQRRAILGPIETQLAELRNERDSLIKKMDALRAADLAEWQSRCTERETKWRNEELERARKAEEQQYALTKELEAARAKKLEELRNELEEIRLDEQEKRDALWTARNEALQELETKLIEKEKELCRLQHEIRAENELLEEDNEAFAAKVARFGTAKIVALEEELAATTARLKTAIKVRDQYYQDVAAREELERELGGRSAKDILGNLDALKRRCAELQSKLDSSFGEETAQRLELCERELSAVQEQRAVLQGKLVDAEQRLIAQRTAAVGKDSLQREKEALETSNKILAQALESQEKLLGAKINELRAEVEQYTQADEQRNPFEALVVLDGEAERKQKSLGGSLLTSTLPPLAEFAKDLRDRIAVAHEGKRLYYSERDIRCFLGGLAMSKLMLLQGISGTGKTSLPRAFARAVGAESAIVEVQAGWRDRQDLLGYYNAFHRKYYTTNFLQALYKAGTPGYRERLFIIVLDEINLSRVEQFFADFLSALELDENSRRITLHSDSVGGTPPALLEDGRHLRVPPNVWFVGTANHDETTTEFADKTYDRAHVMELPRNREQFEPQKTQRRDPISFKALMEEMRLAQEKRKGDVSIALDWLRKGDLANTLDKRFRVGWGNRLERDVERFMPVVVEAGGSIGEAVDHLLRTKVFRKLRDRHDVRVKALEEVRSDLEKAWPKSFGDKPIQSLDLIDREIHAKNREDEG